MEKIEKEIIDATKEFAKSNKVHYDEITESMILNAIREYKLRFTNCSNCNYSEAYKKGRAIGFSDGFNKGSEE